MRATFNRKELESVLQKIVGVIPTKAIKPVLSGVCVKATADHVVFTATDMEIAIQIQCSPLFLELPDSFIADAKLFYELVKTAPTDEIILIFEDNKLKLKTASSQTVIPWLDAAEFPKLELEAVPEGQKISLQANFAIGLEQIIYASATDELMRALNGVNVEIEDSNVRLVCADGFRMAFIDVPGVYQARELPVLLSLKAARCLLNFAKQHPNGISMFAGEKTVLALDGTEALLMRTRDVSFPDYRRVIPAEYHTLIKTERALMMKNLKYVKVVAKGAGEAVRLTTDGTNITLSARSTDRGTVDAAFFCEQQGNNAHIAFNPDFVVQALEELNEPEVLLEIVDEKSPMRIREAGYTAVVMPVSAD